MADRIKVYSYDPKEVSVIIGTNIITGFAQGTFVRVSYNQNAIDYQPGLAQGAITLNPNKEGTLQITLMQVSDANAVLQNYLTRTRARQSGFYFPFLINNNSGQEVAAADAAWVVKEPDLNLATAAQNWTWQIKTGNLIMTLNANYTDLAAGTASATGGNP